MERLLTIQQLSELIQYSPKTIYQWVHIGFVPHVKFPKGIRFKESQIMTWLRSKDKKGRSCYRIQI
ncbi:helix-turn-helix domain-containing protein [Patescibacteria group bacterium]|nr:helix-turn-helix domain-containing protein [Patescibacteria group bacterium]